MQSFPSSYTLNNSLKCPIIGQGTAYMSNNKLISDVIYNSIKNGSRLIDTAAIYGTEEGIGLGLQRVFEEKICKREDLFIITKFHVRERNNPEESLERSLKRLKLDYVDLLLDHWPAAIIYSNNKKILNPLHIVWEKMEKCVEKKLTKSIGGSNYNVQTLMNVLSFCKIKPAFLEVEFHPFLFQKELLHFCNKENIKILCYNPLCKGNYDYHTGKDKIDTELLDEKVIKELSEKYEKTCGQIVLNWHINLGVIPIPMTQKIDRMIENLNSVGFKMEKEDYDKISSLNKNYRFGSSLTWGIVDDIDIFA